MDQYDKTKFRKEAVNIGDVFITKHWGDVVITCNKNTTKLGIRFLNTGNERVCRHAELKRGKVRDEVEYERTGTIESYVCPKKIDAEMHPGEIYPSNLWGDVEIVNYISNKNVTIMFVNTGNTQTTQKWNILQGYTKDQQEEKRLMTQKEATRQKEKEMKREVERQSKLEKEEIRKFEQSLTDQRKENRKLWVRIVRELRFHFDSEGKVLYGTHHTDQDGLAFVVGARQSFDNSTWKIFYVESGNSYDTSESFIKQGTVQDRNNPIILNLKKYKAKVRATVHYEANRDRIIRQASDYQRNNAEKTRVRNRNRRARRDGAEGTHTLEESHLLLWTQQNKCACCSVPLSEATRELDHKMPLILGGSNWIDNLQWLCQFCNSSKNGSHPDSWAVYSSSDAFKSRRLDRLKKDDENWVDTITSMPPVLEYLNALRASASS